MQFSDYKNEIDNLHEDEIREVSGGALPVAWAIAVAVGAAFGAGYTAGYQAGKDKWGR